MRFDRNFADDLFIEGNAALDAARCRQQAVIDSFSSSKPMALQIKCQAGNENQIQVIEWNLDAISNWLADAELTRHDFMEKVFDLTQQVKLAVVIKTRQSNSFFASEPF